ncbi:hypothetical protein ANN_01071 [Periplaneta americana]|uniref:Uncharacterized protein n=1 Tax=Periplaneta americana TaxID=6978 RepID=A0ABQ8TSL7_PERAM|nr:hypothetical protein ANN_01071 [Periplaneta americana]
MHDRTWKPHYVQQLTPEDCVRRMDYGELMRAGMRIGFSCFKTSSGVTRPYFMWEVSSIDTIAIIGLHKKPIRLAQTALIERGRSFGAGESSNSSPESCVGMTTRHNSSRIRNRSERRVVLYFQKSTVTVVIIRKTNVKKQARRLISMFSSTYVCEQTFSKIKIQKLRLRSSLNDDVLLLSTTEQRLDIDNLLSSKH